MLIYIRKIAELFAIFDYDHNITLEEYKIEEIGIMSSKFADLLIKSSFQFSMLQYYKDNPKLFNKKIDISNSGFFLIALGKLGSYDLNFSSDVDLLFFFDDEKITTVPMYKRARLGIGYLPQQPSIFRGLSVEDNILSILEVTLFIGITIDILMTFLTNKSFILFVCVKSVLSIFIT